MISVNEGVVPYPTNFVGEHDKLRSYIEVVGEPVVWGQVLISAQNSPLANEHAGHQAIVEIPVGEGASKLVVRAALLDLTSEGPRAWFRETDQLTPEDFPTLLSVTLRTSLDGSDVLESETRYAPIVRTELEVYDRINATRAAVHLVDLLHETDDVLNRIKPESDQGVKMIEVLRCDGLLNPDGTIPDHFSAEVMDSIDTQMMTELYALPSGLSRIAKWVIRNGEVQTESFGSIQYPIQLDPANGLLESRHIADYAQVTDTRDGTPDLALARATGIVGVNANPHSLYLFPEEIASCAELLVRPQLRTVSIENHTF